MKRAVAPGRTCKPSRASYRIAPASESPTRVALYPEDQGAREVTGAAHDDARAVEHDVGQLEAIPELGQGQRIAAGYDPVTEVALGVAPGEVHLGGVARVGRRAPGGEREARHEPRPRAGSGHGGTLSVPWMRAFVESAAFSARPTALAPGMLDFARIESCCRSVRVSRLASPLPERPQAAARTSPMISVRVMVLILVPEPASHEHPVGDHVHDHDERPEHGLGGAGEARRVDQRD